MDYSEYRIQREGRRSQDVYTLIYEPKDSPCGVREQLPIWIAKLVVSILKEKCPENVSENEYGYLAEKHQYADKMTDAELDEIRR